MNFPNDVVMGDSPSVVTGNSASSVDLDPVVAARLSNFPQHGRECRLLERWLSGPSIAAKEWLKSVDLVRSQIEQHIIAFKMDINEDTMDAIKHMLWPENALATFSKLGMESEVLTTLFGDPNIYRVSMCSGPSLVNLIRNAKPVEVLIGTWIPSKIFDDDDAMSESPTQSTAAALQHTLVRPYNGPGVAWLESALQKYIKMYDAGEHYGKTIVIMQSSGTGKSRTAAEFTTNSRKYWGVHICFRGMGSSKDLHDRYPWGDIPVCQFLCSPNVPGNMQPGSLKGEEIAAAFIGALFDVIHKTIEDAGRGRSVDKAKEAFNASWGVPDITRYTDSPRNKNFIKVQEKANHLLQSCSLEMRNVRAMMPTPSSDQMEVDGMPDPAVNSSSSDSTAWINMLYDIFINASAKKLKQDQAALKLSCFILVFDEFTSLNFDLLSGDHQPRDELPLNRITLLAMQRIIKVCDRLDNWFLMLDTTSGLHDLYPAVNDVLRQTWLLEGKFRPLPPWLYLPINVMVPPQNKLPKMPLEALRLDRLQVYGRPLWATYREHELLEAVTRKLLCGDSKDLFNSPSSEKVKLRVFALHAVRFILNLHAKGAANSMAVASVESHLRYLTHYDPVSGVLKSEVPSEPILAVAAGKFLLDNEENYKSTMRILIEELILSDEIISLGEQGETLARIILLVNRDATIHAEGGQICVIDTTEKKITEQTYDRERNLPQHLHYAVRPFTLASYLQKLVDQTKVTFIDVASSSFDWAQDIYMNFTHFAQLEHTVDKHLSLEFVTMCWRKGFALQCAHNQPIVDLILIGYRGDLSKPFDPAGFVFVVVQVKYKFEAEAYKLIDSITCPFIKTKTRSWKPEYMAILMDMGTPTCFSGINGRDRQVRVTQKNADKGKAWPAFEADKEHPAIRINIRGLRPYRCLDKWAPEIHQLRNSKIGSTAFTLWEEKLTANLRVTKNVFTAS